MGINLEKGQTINLDKSTNDLTKLTIGLGWKIRQKKGFLAKIFSGAEYDLDAVAFLLDANGKIANPGDQRLTGGDVIYFNNLNHPTGCIRHTGDNLVGGAGIQDDEQIIVQLASVPPHIHRILFIVAIYEGLKKRQSFGGVEGAFMRAVDNRGQEIARYNLADDPSFENMRSMTFGELYRKDNEWKFRAIGEGHQEDSFVNLLPKYLPM